MAVQPRAHVEASAPPPDGPPASAAGPVRVRPSSPWPTVGLALSSAAAAAHLVYLGRGTTFFFDEWEFVINRSAGLGRALLEPHAGHPSIVPVAVYQALFEVVGLRRYLPYRLVLVVLHLLVCALLFVYARRRAPAPAALLMATALLFFGSAWNDLLWPFQIGYLASLAGLLGALLCLDRRDLRGDVGACACLLIAVTSSGLGLPAAAGAAAHVALSPGRLRRSVIVVVPLLAYGALVLAFPDGGSEPSGENLTAVPGYVASAATSVARALFGGGVVVATVAVLAGVGLLLRQAWAHPDDRAQLAVLATIPLSFWVLTALARADLGEPGASRYLYPGALFALLLVAEGAKRVRRIGPAVLLPLLGLTALSIGVNVGPLREGRAFLAEVSLKLRAELAALEIARPALADPGFRPEPVWAPNLSAGGYFEVVDRLGSPTYGEAHLRRLSNRERYDADRVLERAKLLRIGPVGDHPADLAGRPPPVDQLLRGSLTTDGACVAVGADGEAAVALTVPPQGVTVAAATAGDLEVDARRFGDEFGLEPLTVLPSGTSASFVPAVDRSTARWHLRLRGPSPVRVCSAARPRR